MKIRTITGFALALALLAPFTVFGALAEIRRPVSLPHAAQRCFTSPASDAIVAGLQRQPLCPIRALQLPRLSR